MNDIRVLRIPLVDGVLFCAILILNLGCKKDPISFPKYQNRFGLDGVYVNSYRSNDSIIINNDSFRYSVADSIPGGITKDGSEFIISFGSDTSAESDTSWVYVFHTKDLSLIGDAFIQWREKPDTIWKPLNFLKNVSYKKQ